MKLSRVELTIALDAEKRKFVIRPRPQQRFFVGMAAFCKASGLTTGRQVAPAASVHFAGHHRQEDTSVSPDGAYYD